MREQPVAVIAIVAEEGFRLTLEDLCRAAAVSPAWIIERVQCGLIEAHGASEDAVDRAAHEAWHFDAQVLRRVRSMRRIELGFGAEPELAALVADLEGEVARLRELLQLARH